jgi:hypothetical protein
MQIESKSGWYLGSRYHPTEKASMRRLKKIYKENPIGEDKSGSGVGLLLAGALIAMILYKNKGS